MYKDKIIWSFKLIICSYYWYWWYCCTNAYNSS